MKARIAQEVDVKYLAIDVQPRYWEDADVNGVEESDDDPKIPLKRASGDWELVIDLETGKISDWPEGITANVHYKVCDAGTYSLLDKDGLVVRRLEEVYVPKMLCPKEDGYGDYIIMDINVDGTIDGFEADLRPFEKSDED